MCELLEDFANLKVGGLLPDQKRTEVSDAIPDHLEWRVVVFPRGQSPSKKVIRPESIHTSPCPEGD